MAQLPGALGQMPQRAIGDVRVAVEQQPLEQRVARPLLAPDPDEAAASVRLALAERTDAAIGDAVALLAGLLDRTETGRVLVRSVEYAV